MSNKRALRFVNETEGERELRRLHFNLRFYAVMVLVCVIMTAGGTYRWGKIKSSEEEKSVHTAAVTAAADTESVVKFNPVNLHYIEVISGDAEEPISEAENSLYESVPLDEEYKLFVIEKCADIGVSPAVVFSMMYHESRYRADMIGDGGDSLGIMQVQPRWHSGRMAELGCDDLLDPYDNITVAIDYLGELMERYDGDVGAALTAYNRGSYCGKVSRYAELVIEESERIGEAR